MKPYAVIALMLATVVTAPAFAGANSLSSKLQWAADAGTHIYDIPNMEKTFRPSLELGLRTALPLKTFSVGTLALETGMSTSAIYGASDVVAPFTYEGYTLSAAQVNYRRMFLSVTFETQGIWFFKPELGVESKVSKLRLFDSELYTGINIRETNTNAFGSLGVGYHFHTGKKAVVSFAALGDESDNIDYRVTLTASF